MNFEEQKKYTLESIKKSDILKEPFHHLFIENILSPELYSKIIDKCKYFKNPDIIQNRNQDSSKFMNRRYNFANLNDDVIVLFKQIFEDEDVKQALFSKFFVNTSKFLKNMKVHTKEFEVVFTEKDRFQNIHVDIPPKFLSLVFYLPEVSTPFELSDTEIANNSTVLYDKSMNPVHSAKYKPNSVCVFAPHFYSYHGFATTIERTAIVLFYIDEKFLVEHDSKIAEVDRRKRKETDFKTFKNNILYKLKEFPLIEFKDQNLEEIMKECKINAPNGRVL